MKILFDQIKKTCFKIHNLFFLFLAILIISCETQKKTFYIKARNKEEVKIGAFEICGRDSFILA